MTSVLITHTYVTHSIRPKNNFKNILKLPAFSQNKTHIHTYPLHNYVHIVGVCTRSIQSYIELPFYMTRNVIGTFFYKRQFHTRNISVSRGTLQTCMKRT